jgi:hypothetical protein
VSDLSSDPFDQWMRWQGYVLAAKAVNTREALAVALRRDRAASISAARDLRGRRTSSLLIEFFQGDKGLLKLVSPHCNEEFVNHLGFQIAEPMDIYLDGVYGWKGRVGDRVIGVKRFASSDAFRTRVGAFAEMAQVWWMIGTDVVELEIFDIHRPSHAAPIGAGDEHVAVRELLDGDDIWHYGVHVSTDGGVRYLRDLFAELAGIDPRYVPKNAEIVGNRWHGSINTKLVNVDLGLELEFMTYNADWSRF